MHRCYSKRFQAMESYSSVWNAHDTEEASIPSSLGSIHKVQYISESYTSNRFDVFKNYLRKNTENYVLIPQKNCIVMPGPKRNKYENPPGIVIAYNSGYIISIGNRPETVGIGNSSDSLVPYADWVRKKFRSHNCEPSCKQLKNTRLLNVLGRVDFPPQQEVFLEELHDFLVIHFPHWKIVYDPEVFPCMTICRFWGEEEETGLQNHVQYMTAFNQNIDPPTTEKSTASDEVREPYTFKTTVTPSNGRRALEAPHFFFATTADTQFRWPSTQQIQQLQQRDKELRSQSNKDKASFLKCFIIIGTKHIVAHRAESKEAFERAIHEIMAIVVYFIGPPHFRWPL